MRYLPLPCTSCHCGRLPAALLNLLLCSFLLQSTVYAADKPPLRQRRWLQPGFLFTAALLATAAAVAGVSTWGLIESIDATNHTVSNFWGIVDDVSARVREGQSLLCSTLPGPQVGWVGA